LKLLARVREYLRESITVQLTSCLAGLEMCVCAVQNSMHPAQTLIC